LAGGNGLEEWGPSELRHHLDQGDSFLLFLFTPFCGTCRFAERMLSIVEHLHGDKRFVKSDVQYVPELVRRWKISSVPCLVFVKDGEAERTMFAFHSVDHLHAEIKTYGN